MQTQCKICLETYNSTSNIPKILSCGHTFCHQCILSMVKDQKVECPFDRIIAQESEVRDNLLLKEYILNQQNVDHQCDLLTYCKYHNDFICKACSHLKHQNCDLWQYSLNYFDIICSFLQRSNEIDNRLPDIQAIQMQIQELTFIRKQKQEELFQQTKNQIQQWKEKVEQLYKQAKSKIQKQINQSQNQINQYQKQLNHNFKTLQEIKVQNQKMNINDADFESIKQLYQRVRALNIDQVTQIDKKFLLKIEYNNTTLASIINSNFQITIQDVQSQKQDIKQLKVQVKQKKPQTQIAPLDYFEEEEKKQQSLNLAYFEQMMHEIQQRNRQAQLFDVQMQREENVINIYRCEKL